MVVFAKAPQLAPGEAAPVLGEGVRHLSLVPPVEGQPAIDGQTWPVAVEALKRGIDFHFSEMERLEGQHPERPDEAAAVDLMGSLERQQADILISRALNLGIKVDLLN